MRHAGQEEAYNLPDVSFFTRAKSRAFDLSALFYCIDPMLTAAVPATEAAPAFFNSFLRRDFPDRNVSK